MKVYVVEEHYYSKGSETVTPIKVFQSKVDAKKSVEEHEDDYRTYYDIYMN